MEHKEFYSIKIGLASPEMIRSWSHGEVIKPETINYRTLKAEAGGLFCERIFGPTKDGACMCGKYKNYHNRDVIRCEKCGVDVTTKKVRRERMGHIELASPVSHIWYFKTIPSRMALVLDISPKQLEQVLYFAENIVLDPGITPLTKGMVLSERMYMEYREMYGDAFRVGMGAEAIKELLSQIDVNELSTQLKAELETATGQKKARIIKRLEVVEAFRKSGNRLEWMILEAIPVIPPDIRPMVQLDGGRFASSDLNELYRRVISRNNRLKKLMEIRTPEIVVRNEKRMLQEAVDALIDNGRRGKPVTGPSNRPLKSLSEMLRGKQGRFRQNLLGKRVDYSGRSVIVVGPSLKIYQCGLPKEMALELFKPFVIKRLVEMQKATNVKDAQKKIDRSHDPANAAVWDALDNVIKEHPVLLNRAPTLHRLSIQAFEPVLVEGRAIKLHPLVCTAFNADFDGDQMPVHVPLSAEAQAEARFLMLSANNLLKPMDGRAVTVPTQDMVLGCYYLTMEKAGDPGEGRVFRDFNEAVMAYKNGQVGLHAHIYVRTAQSSEAVLCRLADYKANTTTAGTEITFTVPCERIITPTDRTCGYTYVRVLRGGDEIFRDNTTAIVGGVEEVKHGGECTLLIKGFSNLAEGDVIEVCYKNTAMIHTTLGRMIFNRPLPQDLGFVNRADFTKVHNLEIDFVVRNKDLGHIIDRCISKHGTASCAIMLDQIKEMGFKYSTRSGLSISVYDMTIPKEKAALIAEAEKKVETITKHYMRGRLSEEERYKNVIAIWEQTTADVTAALQDSFDPNNPLRIMSDSGARGSITQMRQLAGMRGPMFAASGKTMEIPIRSNFREGMKIFEYFMGARSSRKSLSDTALRTADSGYLTRRLVDVAQEVIVREEKCSTEKGMWVSTIIDEDKNVIEPLVDRILGRYTMGDVINPKTGEVIVPDDTMISDDDVARIIETGIERVHIRSVLQCKTRNGVCAHCYGADLATGKPVSVGESVGIIAAQSIGEPGTQLTMRTFHSGGVAGADITQGLPRVEELFEARQPKKSAIIAEVSGMAYVTIGENANTHIITIHPDKTDDNAFHEIKEYNVPYGTRVIISDEERVEVGQALTEGNKSPADIMRILGLDAVYEYLIKEIQRVYRSQSCNVNDKHIEIIIRQMTRKVKIEDSGDTDMLLGSLVDINEFEDKNEQIAEANRADGGNRRPAEGSTVLLGITKAALLTESFLSAASFQETTRVLTDAAIKGKVDRLLGLKENVIIGKLIPAGTGMDCYRNVEVKKAEGAGVKAV
ncbi:MAG: DNA-directed RNA polymerase subunit beta' [Eubacteriales bacterium]